jgi:dihydrofolate synthase/folylpolyglutamate synthase
MPDHAISQSPAVQAQLDRLWSLSPGVDILGLERITELLARLGDPHLRLPPVLHVAGTNGKGSTCAFLRASLEAAGLAVHVYSSPHLVRFNERIRLAGTLIDDAALAALLSEVLDAAENGGEDLGASFFEITTAAAFLAFSRIPADACVIEVGLGGRLDATNVVQPVVTGIAQLGIDHQSFLGDSAVGIAAEKAGIAKPGVALVTMHYAEDVAARVAEVATAAGATVRPAGSDWSYAVDGDRLVYTDEDGRIETPLPTLTGPHQPHNLALAIAILRHQPALAVPEAAFATAATATRWPARMQRLSPGPLTAMLPRGSQLWLDGGHNPAAAEVVAESLRQVAWVPGEGRGPTRMILGMLSNKDPAGLLAPFAGLVDRLYAVPIANHEHHSPDALAAMARRLGIKALVAGRVEDALDQIADTLDPQDPPVVLILGSLYLAGEVLAANDELPQ